MYGAQLKTLSLYGQHFDEQCLRNLAASCPDVAVSISDNNVSNLALLMDILGPLLPRIEASQTFELTYADSAAAAKCVNMESVKIDCENAEVYFWMPKPRLREFRLYGRSGAANQLLSDTLCNIARRTGSLRRVSLTLSKVRADALLALAETNI